MSFYLRCLNLQNFLCEFFVGDYQYFIEKIEIQPTYIFEDNHRHFDNEPVSAIDRTPQYYFNCFEKLKRSHAIGHYVMDLESLGNLGKGVSLPLVKMSVHLVFDNYRELIVTCLVDDLSQTGTPEFIEKIQKLDFRMISLNYSIEPDAFE